MDYRAILKSLPLWQGSKISAKRLLGGGTNDNFLVTVGGTKYVARFQGESQRKSLGLNRGREIYNTKVAHSLGIGPQVVAHYPKYGLLLVRYLEGRVLKRYELRQENSIRTMVRMLKRLHRGPAFHGRFSVLDSIEHFWSIARRDGKRLPGFGRPELDKFRHCADRIRRRRTRLLPCHADIVSINIVRRGRELKIIDWDYSSMADPLFELAFMAGWSRFTPANNRLLLKLYFGQLTPELQSQFKAMTALFHLREAVWALVQIGRSKVPGFNYHRYLVKHIQWFKQIRV